jgi:hypothetical protein
MELLLMEKWKEMEQAEDGSIFCPHNFIIMKLSIVLTIAH